MNTIRAFIAVEIDNQTKQKISELISDLKKSNADVKWITENQMHLTLKFLGNIDENKVADISNALSRIADNLSAFTINFSGLGAFPGMNHPRVVWLGVNKGAESLIKLNEKIETAMEKTGFKKENRKFEPHLTLARIRSSKNISNLIKLIDEVNFSAENDTHIDKLVLFQSTLNPKGALYKIILEKNLRKA